MSLLQSASHSSIECDVRTIEFPWLNFFVKASQRHRRATGSTPVVGSSRNETEGSPNNAFNKNKIFFKFVEKFKDNEFNTHNGWTQLSFSASAIVFNQLIDMHFEIQ